MAKRMSARNALTTQIHSGMCQLCWNHAFYQTFEGVLQRPVLKNLAVDDIGKRVVALTNKNHWTNGNDPWTIGTKLGLRGVLRAGPPAAGCWKRDVGSGTGGPL